jgi:hypothetical protein
VPGSASVIRWSVAELVAVSQEVPLLPSMANSGRLA